MSQAKLDHPTRDELLSFIAGRLRSEACRQIEEHLSDCQHCLNILGSCADDDPLVDVARQAAPLLTSSRADMPCQWWDGFQTPDHLGDYRILREIGRGGMGVVYEAIQETLGRQVALKVLARDVAGNESAWQRFRREASAAAKLHHTNIVPVFEIGDHTQRFYSMQYIDGCGLDQVLSYVARSPGIKTNNSTQNSPSTVEGAKAERLSRSLCRFVPDATVDATGRVAPSVESDRRDPVDWPHYFRQVASIGSQVADALAYAHAQGLLHRDIKPGNILLDDQGTAWITDFGLVKTEDAAPLTNSGDVVGTLRYMAPESFEGQADQRSDVYSLGLTLYEMVALRPAFDTTDRRHLIRLVTEGKTTPLSKLQPRLPADLLTIIEKASEASPQHRYASAEELALDLWRFLNDEPVRARPISSVERVLRWSRRNPTLACLTAVVVVVAVGAIMAAVSFRQLAQDRELNRISAVEAEKRARSAQLVAEERADAMRQHLYYTDMRLAGQALHMERGIGLAEEILSKWEPGYAGVDLRGWEWHYLTSRCRQQDSLTIRVRDQLLGVAWHPIDSRIATATGDGKLAIWNGKTGELIHDLRGDQIKSPFVAWNPVGTLLASAGHEKLVRIWDPDSGSQVSVLAGHQSKVWSVDWNPDGRRLASTSTDRTVRIWDTKNGKEVLRLEGHTDTIKSVSWSPDGWRLASTGNDEMLRVWDADSGQQLFAVRVDHHRQYCVEWSPDGSQIVTSGRNWAVKTWDAKTGRLKLNLPGHIEGVYHACWSRGGELLATAGIDGSVCIWNGTTGQQIRTIRAHAKSVTAVSWSPDDSHLVSASKDGTLKVWDLSTPPLTSTLSSGHDNYPVRSIAWSPDSKQLVSGGGGTVCVWNTLSGKRIRQIGGLSIPVYSVAWSPDGKNYAAAGKGGVVHVWDASTGEKALVLKGHNDTIQCLAWSPDSSRIVASGDDRRLRIWDRESGKAVHVIDSKSGNVHSVAWSPDGEVLASGGKAATLRLWNANSGAAMSDRKIGSTSLRVISWSPHYRWLATAVNDRKVTLWDTRSLAPQRMLSLNFSVSSITWSPDETRLATAGPDDVKIWDVATGKETLTLRGHTGATLAVAWSPDGRSIASSSYDSTINLFEAQPRPK